MEVGGQFVFTSIVLVANFKILISSYQYNGWVLLWIFGSVIQFLVVFYIITLFPSANEYDIFVRLFSFPQTYYALLLFTSGYVLIDGGLHYGEREINRWYITRKEKEERRATLKAKADPSITRRRVSMYKSK